MHVIPHAKMRAWERFGLTEEDMTRVCQKIESNDCFVLQHYRNRINYLVNHNNQDLVIVYSKRRNLIITVMPFTVNKVFEKI